MRNKNIFFWCVIAAVMCCAKSFAQNIPTDGGIWNGNGPGTTWAGDTIIHQTPFGNIGGSIHHSPSASNASVYAIHYSNYIFITTNTEVSFSYALRDEDLNLILRGQATASAACPALVDLTTLPSGHYTLLLYINNECLEGEFEKE